MSAMQQLNKQIQHEVTVAGLSNAFFNGVIAWLLLKGGSNLTLAGEHSYAVDILATAFILPFIVTLIVIPLNQRKQAAGKIPAVRLDQGHWLEAGVLCFPASLGMRALYFGFFSMLIFSPLTLLPLWLLGLHEFTPAAYAAFKGVWAGAMAAALTPPMLLLAVGKD
ncbi:MAG: hypothetical protein ABJ308_05380 [Halieaceae bacterium]